MGKWVIKYWVIQPNDVTEKRDSKQEEFAVSLNFYSSKLQQCYDLKAKTISYLIFVDVWSQTVTICPLGKGMV